MSRNVLYAPSRFQTAASVAIFFKNNRLILSLRLPPVMSDFRHTINKKEPSKIVDIPDLMIWKESLHIKEPVGSSKTVKTPITIP
jgi:hypothetical protein